MRAKSNYTWIATPPESCVDTVEKTFLDLERFYEPWLGIGEPGISETQQSIMMGGGAAPRPLARPSRVRDRHRDRGAQGHVWSARHGRRSCCMASTHLKATLRKQNGRSASIHEMDTVFLRKGLQPRSLRGFSNLVDPMYPCTKQHVGKAEMPCNE